MPQVALVSSSSWGGGRGAARTAAGVGLALGAVACAAVYKVRFKARFGAPPTQFVLRFVGAVGLGAALGGLGFAAALEPSPAAWTRGQIAIVLIGGGRRGRCRVWPHLT